LAIPVGVSPAFAKIRSTETILDREHAVSLENPESAKNAAIARNPALLCVHHALMMSLFPMPVLTLFQQDHLGLSMVEIMIVQALFGLSLALFEFPSGYLADRIGYRLS